MSLGWQHFPLSTFFHQTSLSLPPLASMPFGTFLDTVVWGSLDIPQEQQLIHCFSLTLPCRQTLRHSGFSTSNDSFSLASDIWDAVSDCPDTDKRSICLTSFRLHPALPLESMGIGLGFGEESGDPPIDLDKIHCNDLQEMDNQIHSSSLCLSHSYRRAMEFLEDDLLLDMEEKRAFLHCNGSHSALTSLSHLLRVECQHLHALPCFQLIQRGEFFLFFSF